MMRLVAAVSLTPNKNQPKQTTAAEIKKVGRYENIMKNKLARATSARYQASFSSLRALPPITLATSASE